MISPVFFRIMHSKTLYLLLAFAVTIAAVTAYWDDDDEDDELFDLEDFMEKRGRKSGRKGKGKGKKPKWQRKSVPITPSLPPSPHLLHFTTPPPPHAYHLHIFPASLIEEILRIKHL